MEGRKGGRERAWKGEKREREVKVWRGVDGRERASNSGRSCRSGVD